MDSEVLALVVRMVDEASDNAKKIAKHIGDIGGSAGKAKGHLSDLGGALANMAKVGIGAAVGGLTALGGALAYATKQAADEQVGIAALGQSLKNNVKNWDGNTAAIEETIKKQESLGFSDDALRKSLSALVVKTHDVAKAQKIQAVAMDLARAKGVDLQTATDILIKAENGQTRALKAMGIEIKPVTAAQDALKASTKKYTEEQMKAAKAADAAATSQNVLAGVMEATKGQAEAYGKTTAGAFEALKIRVDDLVEDVGGALLPVATDFARLLTDKLVPAAQDIAGKFAGWVEANKPLLDQLSKLAAGVLTELVTTLMTKVVPGFVELITKVGQFGAQIARDVGPTIKDLVDKFTALVPVAIKVGETIFDLAKRVWEGGLNKAVATAGKLIGGVVEVIGKLVAAILNDKTTMDTLRTIADAIGLAFAAAANFVDGMMTNLGKFVDGIAANKPLMKFLSAEAHYWGVVFNIAAKAVLALVGGIKELSKYADLVLLLTNPTAWNSLHAAAIPGTSPTPAPSPSPSGTSYPLVAPTTSSLNYPITSPTTTTTTKTTSTAPTTTTTSTSTTSTYTAPHSAYTGAMATGGPVRGGERYLIGERGPELFVPGANGRIIANDQLGAGGSVYVNVTVNGSALFDPYGAAATQIANALLPGLRRALDRNGMSLA